MGTEKERDKGKLREGKLSKLREGKLKKNREEIADLQQKIKSMIDRRNGDNDRRSNSGKSRDGE